LPSSTAFRHVGYLGARRTGLEIIDSIICVAVMGELVLLAR